MRDTLLQYVFKLSVETPAASPDTSYIRNILFLAKPLAEDTPAEIKRCVSEAEIAALTNNQEAAQILKGGKSYIYVLPSATLDIADILAASPYKFFTVMAGSEFTEDEYSAKDFGGFEGVSCRVFTDQEKAKAFAAKTNQCGFFTTAETGAKNAAFAFGSLLSAPQWDNRQFIDMPLSGGVNTLGAADSLFDDRVSFVLSSQEYGNVLAFFTAGKQAIIAPYITEEIRTRQQGRALGWIRQNKPQYTLTDAKLLERYLQQQLEEDYVDTGLIESAKVTVELTADNFIATGNISISEPKALWRLQGTLTQEAN